MLKDLIEVEEKKTEEAKIIEVNLPEPVKEELIAEMESRHDEIKISSDTSEETNVKEVFKKETIASPVDQKVMEERAMAINKTSKPVSKSGNLFEEAVVADKDEGKQTIHEKFSKSKEDKSWHDKLQSQPVMDLKKSIGINEKFKFVNQLFDGHLQDYNESIDVLNNFKTLSEAQNFVEQTLMPKFNWKKESGVYQSLMFLIQRKFNN